MPAFLNSPYRLDWLALRRLRFYTAKAIANQHWEAYRYFKHACTTPSAVLREVLSKIQRGRKTHTVEPKSLLAPISEGLLSFSAYKRPRGPRSPPQAVPPDPTYYGSQDTRAISPKPPADRLVTMLGQLFHIKVTLSVVTEQRLWRTNHATTLFRLPS